MLLRRAFLAGMVWFIIWSVACGVAQNEVSIDFFRAMQGAGLGAAIVCLCSWGPQSRLRIEWLTPYALVLLQPAALGILGSSFPPGQRKTTAFAVFSAGAPLGGGVGAVLGGVYVTGPGVHPDTPNLNRSPVAQVDPVRGRHLAQRLFRLGRHRRVDRFDGALCRPARREEGPLVDGRLDRRGDDHERGDAVDFCARGRRGRPRWGASNGAGSFKVSSGQGLQWSRSDSVLPSSLSGARRTSRLSLPSRSCSSSPFGTTSGTSSGTRRVRRS